MDVKALSTVALTRQDISGSANRAGTRSSAPAADSATSDPTGANAAAVTRLLFPSPYARYDPSSHLEILQFRDTGTGKVMLQIPPEKVVEVYQRIASYGKSAVSAVAAATVGASGGGDSSGATGTGTPSPGTSGTGTPAGNSAAGNSAAGNSATGTGTLPTDLYAAAAKAGPSVTQAQPAPTPTPQPVPVPAVVAQAQGRAPLAAPTTLTVLA